jgi:hypothetical protein
MASFAEGLVKGLQQQQELNLRRSEQKRQQAISMSQLASAEEERQYRREQRDKQEKAVGEIRQLMDNVFGYDEPAQAVPGQAPGQAAPAQTVRKQYDIYDSSPEGRERQLRYHSGYTRILMNNGLMSPADMKASAEYAGYLDKSGVSDAALNLFLTDGRDAKSLGFLAKKLNLDPNSVKITGSLVDNSAKIEAVGANGQAFSRPLGDIFSALGINAFENIQENKRKEQVTAATLENLEARTGLVRGQTRLAGSRAAALDAGAQEVKLKDLPRLYSSMKGPTDTNAPIMPQGQEILRTAIDGARDAGATGKQATDFAISLVSKMRTDPAHIQDMRDAAKAQDIDLERPSLYNMFEQQFLSEKVREFVNSDAGQAQLRSQFGRGAAERASALDATQDPSAE